MQQDQKEQKQLFDGQSEAKRYDQWYVEALRNNQPLDGILYEIRHVGIPQFIKIYYGKLVKEPDQITDNGHVMQVNNLKNLLDLYLRVYNHNNRAQRVSNIQKFDHPYPQQHNGQYSDPGQNRGKPQYMKN